jgi:signal transduction histidine kinase
VTWKLISDAIKFTPKGGRVVVHLERVESRVEVAVSDTGPGITIPIATSVIVMCFIPLRSRGRRDSLLHRSGDRRFFIIHIITRSPRA